MKTINRSETMEINNLYEIWEKGNRELFANQKITEDMIEKYLKPRIHKASLNFTFNIIFYSLIQVVCMGLLIVNAIGYRTNPVMLSAIFPMMILTAGFFIYGYFLYVRWKGINNFTRDLKDLVTQKLHFLKTHYEVWMLILSLSSLFLIFGVTTMIDNQDGLYRINNVRLYMGVNIGIFLFIYGINKLASYIALGYLKTCLKDLRNNILEESVKSELRGKKYRWIFIVLAVAFFITFILGFLKSRGII